jgi:hypothetical protein
MARRIVTFHIEVAVDEDAMRAVEDDDPFAWPNLTGCLSTAFKTIADDNLDATLDPQVRLVAGSTKVEYRR